MIEILVNEVTQEGIRRVKVMSDQPVREEWLRAMAPGAARMFAVANSQSTAALSLFYGEVTWPAREVVDFRVACGEGRVRRFVVWKFVPEEEYRLSEIILFLAEWYFVQAHHRPQFAFMRKLPNGIESGMEVEDVTLMQADWALSGCVMVGG